MKIVILLSKVLLPVLLLAAAAVGTVAIIKSKPEVETHRPAVVPPLVQTQTVAVQDYRFIVKSQGTVSPRTESRLIPEVSGRVTWVAPSFESGGFFEKGDVLLRIDPSDYRQTVVRAKADVAQMRLRLAQEEAEADVARKEWTELGEGNTASPLTLREPQLEEARAALASAEAMLEKAERDLDRTEVKAPYAGRIREKNVDVGQYVATGSTAATLYAVDFAEIRLPLPDKDLAYLELPLAYRGDKSEKPGPEVILRNDFAGRTHQWRGHIVRMEGEIDPSSRMVHAVARVKDPYGRGEQPGRPPLVVGMFVDAEIIGRTVENVFVLPRAALLGKDQVLLVDEDDRLRFRTVELLRKTRDELVVSGGLSEGERICLTPLEAVTDGMKVRTMEEEALGTKTSARRES